MESKIKDARHLPDSTTEATKSSGLTFENHSVNARSVYTPIGIPPEEKRSQNANTSHMPPVLDESKLWAAHADLIASLPEEDRSFVQLGIISGYIEQGIKAGKPLGIILQLACLGISIANNDRKFYEDIRTELSHQKN